MEKLGNRQTVVSECNNRTYRFHKNEHTTANTELPHPLLPPAVTVFLQHRSHFFSPLQLHLFFLAEILFEKVFSCVLGETNESNKSSELQLTTCYLLQHLNLSIQLWTVANPEHTTFR